MLFEPIRSPARTARFLATAARKSSPAKAWPLDRDPRRSCESTKPTSAPPRTLWAIPDTRSPRDRTRRPQPMSHRCVRATLRSAWQIGRPLGSHRASRRRTRPAEVSRWPSEIHSPRWLDGPGCETTPTRPSRFRSWDSGPFRGSGRFRSGDSTRASHRPAVASTVQSDRRSALAARGCSRVRPNRCRVGPGCQDAQVPARELVASHRLGPSTPRHPPNP